MADGGVDFVVTRLEWASRDMPVFWAFAVVRIMANSWCTSRRMTVWVPFCLTRVPEARRCGLAARPASAAMGRDRQCMRVAMLVLPMGRPDVWRSFAWAYVACRLHTLAWLDLRALSLVELQRALRAIVCLLSARSEGGREAV